MASTAHAQPNGLPPLARGTETVWNADAFVTWPFPGDANRDCSIDQRDIDKVVADMGQVGRVRVPSYFGSGPDGITFGSLWSDFNGDQVVNAQDLVVVTSALAAGVTAGLPLRANDGAIEFAGSEYGLALVWPDEPVDFGPGWNGSLLPSKPMRTVLLTALGAFDRSTGLRTGSAGGFLDGQFSLGDIDCLRDQADRGEGGDPALPVIPRTFAPDNDFRVSLTGLAHPWPRDMVAWQAEASAYYAVSEWRRRSFNGPFLDRLGLSASQNQRVRVFQGVENWELGQPPANGGCTGTPCLSPMVKQVVKESSSAQDGLGFMNVATNRIEFVTRPSSAPGAYRWTPLWDGRMALLEYPTAVGQWLIGARIATEQYVLNRLTVDAVMVVVGDGLPGWALMEPTARRPLGLAWSTSMQAANGPNGPQILLPSVGWHNAGTVMMHDLDAGGQTTGSRDGVYIPLPWNQNLFDTPAMDHGAQLFNALFLDAAAEAGMGFARANLLYWKAVSLAESQPSTTNVARFGDLVRTGARSLWPNPALPGTSLYEADVHNVLLSRKFMPQGQTDLNALLPAAVGPSVRGQSIRSSHPAYQPGISLGSTTQRIGNWYSDQYTHPETRAAYVAYTWWKHSTFGPCDYLDLVADGVGQPASFFPCDPELLPGEAPLSSATYTRVSGSSVARLRDREIGNLTVLAPGRVLRWVHMRAICPLNPADTANVLDVNAFGHRCIKATPNGFSVRVERLGETLDPSAVRDRVNYRLTIVDPSLNLTGWNTGPAAYAWTFTEFDGATIVASGQTVDYGAIKDQPFTISVTRTRAQLGQPSIVDTLTLRERGTDLDRAGPQGPGRALVLDVVGPGASRDFPLATTTVPCGQPATFTVRALGLTPRTVAWRLNGQPLFNGVQADGSVVVGAGAETLVVTPASTDMAGLYECVISNAVGSAVGQSAVLSVEGCACSVADIATVGGTAEEPGAPDGQLTLDDILVFVNLYSEAIGCPGGAPCSRADVCGIGGPPEAPDGQLTLDDILAFVNAFGEGC